AARDRQDVIEVGIAPIAHCLTADLTNAPVTLPNIVESHRRDIARSLPHAVAVSQLSHQLGMGNGIGALTLSQQHAIGRAVGGLARKPLSPSVYAKRRHSRQSPLAGSLVLGGPT